MSVRGVTSEGGLRERVREREEKSERVEETERV